MVQLWCQNQTLQLFTRALLASTLPSLSSIQLSLLSNRVEGRFRLPRCERSPQLQVIPLLPESCWQAVP
jgi:hypothetical protein